MNRPNDNKNKASMKNLAVILLLSTIIVWIILFLIKINVFNDGKVEVSVLVDDIIGNLLGILPPIIIFNFAYEYLTKKQVAEDISERIAETIMSRSDVIDAFDISAKHDFLSATLISMLAEEKGNVVYSMLLPYTNFVFNIRKEMMYHIAIRQYIGTNQIISDSTLYNLISQNLSYTKFYSIEETPPDYFRLGFYGSSIELDEKFRDKEYLFRENVYLLSDDFNNLISCSENELLNQIDQLFKLKVSINGEKATPAKIERSTNSFDILLKAKLSPYTEMKVDIDLKMPKLKTVKHFQATIAEPTFRPHIIFNWDESIKNVNSVPFMSGEYEMKNSEYYDDRCDLRGVEWIYPMSGVVYTWE